MKFLQKKNICWCNFLLFFNQFLKPIYQFSMHSTYKRATLQLPYATAAATIVINLKRRVTNKNLLLWVNLPNVPVMEHFLQGNKTTFLVIKSVYKITVILLDFTQRGPIYIAWNWDCPLRLPTFVSDTCGVEWLVVELLVQL